MNFQHKILLVDAHALIHRAFHAIPILTTSNGSPINAVFGFTKLLTRVIRNIQPQYIAVAFDSKIPTFRHVEYKEYKAKRPPVPDELKSQFPLVRDLVKGLSLATFEIPCYEADDLIGTLVEHFRIEVQDPEIFIMTGDFDAAQLVDKTVKIYLLKKSIEETMIYDEKNIEEKFHLHPQQIVDYKALKGDPSDNIPGVNGIGDKTAVTLLQQFQTLENIYNSLPEITEKVQKKLCEDQDNAFISKKLATIVKDVPIEFKLDECIWKGWDNDKIIPVLEKFEFQSLIKEFRKNIQPISPKKDVNEQLTLV